jgi:endoglucanase
VLIHPSAAGPTRAVGATIASPGGWYDAGDYNKYIVNSGISTYTLLLLCEQYPDHIARLATNIPESGGALPDLLDEILWNLRWMRTMQDPADGGVYHKLTNAQFDRFERPDQATAPRYVVQKSTAATLDFAAVMAHASLVARRYPKALPGLADSLVAEAEHAWQWARLHPDVVYDQRVLNERYQPAIGTGTYGDGHLDDERSWAAAELFVATGIDSFYVAAVPLPSDTLTVPSWGSVQALGLFTLVEHRSMLPRGADSVALEQRLLSLARPLVARARSSAYRVPIGGPRDWVWGSNAVDANEGVVLVQAYRLTADTSYRDAAVAALDYLLGRNATGYSFVTGYGAKTPLSPHHRPSASDTVVAPVPGLLVAGPNPGQQDNCGGYPSRVPALSYVDAQCNYAANEIAINWNAPVAFLSIAIDAIFSRGGASAATPATSRNHGTQR